MAITINYVELLQYYYCFRRIAVTFAYVELLLLLLTIAFSVSLSLSLSSPSLPLSLFFSLSGDSKRIMLFSVISMMMGISALPSSTDQIHLWLWVIVTCQVQKPGQWSVGVAGTALSLTCKRLLKFDDTDTFRTEIIEG